MNNNCDCQSVFNGLSKADRIKLNGAAATKAITGLIKDDTERKPWRYPFYLAYMAVLGTPLPFFGAGAVLMVATVAWAKLEMSPLAKEMNDRLKDSFNEASLVCKHQDYIEKYDDTEKEYRVKNTGLAWHTTKEVCSNSWLATKHAAKALKNLVI